MANNVQVEQLRARSESVRSAIIQFTAELKKINDEINAYKQAHDAAVANLKAKHEQELAQMIDNYEDLTEEAEKNNTFIDTVGRLLGE